MKGATPRGPRVVIANRTNAAATPIGTGRSLDTAELDRSRRARAARTGSPARSPIASRTRPVIERRSVRSRSVTQSSEHRQRRARPSRRGRTPSRRRRARRCEAHCSAWDHARVGRRREDPAFTQGALPVPDNQVDAVQAAPDDEVPGGAVPQAAEQHREHQVHVGADGALPVAAERDVQVVAQPARQRHVPAPPELLDRPRAVGPVEVLRELEPEQLRDADRDVGVAARSRSRSARRRRRSPTAISSDPWRAGSPKTWSTIAVAR